MSSSKSIIQHEVECQGFRLYVRIRVDSAQWLRCQAERMSQARKMASDLARHYGLSDRRIEIGASLPGSSVISVVSFRSEQTDFMWTPPLIDDLDDNRRCGGFLLHVRYGCGRWMRSCHSSIKTARAAAMRTAHLSGDNSCRIDIGASLPGSTNISVVSFRSRESGDAWTPSLIRNGTREA